MEYKLAYSFVFFVALMLIFGIYSLGSIKSNQPNYQDKELMMLDSLNKRLEISNQDIRAKIERNDSVLKDLEATNKKLRKALNMPEKQ
jgi:hypothetical protein